MFVKGTNLCNSCIYKSLFDGCKADNNIVDFDSEVVIMCNEYAPVYLDDEKDDE